MNRHTILALAALGALAGNCKGTETDPDTDTDTGTGGDPNTFTGTLSYSETMSGFDADGSVSGSCASEFSLSGTEYVGDCVGCDWAFTVSGTETSGDCTDPDPVLTFDASGPYGAPNIAFWTTIYTYYTDVFALGWPYPYGGQTYWDFGAIVTYSYGGQAYGGGTYSLSGTALDWTYEATGTERGELVYLNEDCTASGTAAEAEAAFTSESAQTEDVACDGLTVDVWEFTAAAAGEYAISVDTVADATAFDTVIYVNDPAGCTIDSFDDSFACAFPPPSFECSGATITAATAGTHQIVVRSFGSCAGEDTGSYTLVVNGATPTLAGDDVNFYDSLIETVYSVEGSGTFAFAP